MSKCGINRFKPGGRCSGSGPLGNGVKGDTQLGANFSALLAARDAQDRHFAQPSNTTLPKVYATPALQSVATNQALTLKQTQVAGQKQKQADIDLLLHNDYDAE